MAVMALALALTVAVAVGGVGSAVTDSCFGSLGCFPNGAPWTTPLRPMPPPRSPEFQDIRFHLYTRDAPDRFDVKHPSDGVFDVDGSDFDASRPTIFFTHGYLMSANDDIVVRIKDALIGKSDSNVIMVDWPKGAADVTYLNCAANTRVVAAVTAQLLRHLIASRGVQVAKVHLVGFSLGAHVSGYVGKAIADIGRITALDAAQPGFEGYDKAVRLDVADAVFVDAVHTDARPFIPVIGLGFIGPVGDVDFYVNGGWNQPACLPQTQTIASLADFGTAAYIAVNSSVPCRHLRALHLFVASLTLPNCRFWGHQVDAWQRSLVLATGDWASIAWRAPCGRTTCSELGFDSIHYPGRGSFDVATAQSAPFCLPDAKADSAMAPFYIA